MNTCMATDAKRMNEVFLDTSFAIALSVEDDEHHERAMELKAWLTEPSIRMITTRAIALEIGNALSKRKYREAAVSLLRSMELDPVIDVLPIDDQLYGKGFELFRRRHDKEWGLIDCISFEVMSSRGIEAALTADDHFRQAGFKALLKDEN